MRGLIVAACLLSGGPAAADDAYFPTGAPAAGEEVLPASTLAVVSVPDAAELRRRWDESSFAAMAEDPAFAAFFGDVLGRADLASELFGVDLRQVWAESDGEVTLALVPAAEGSRRSGVSLVAFVDYGVDRAAADAMVGRLEKRLSAAGAESLTLEAGGEPVTIWTPAEGGRRRLAYKRDGGRVVFADGLPALTGLSRDAGKRLSQVGAYRTVRQRTRPAQRDAALSWYLNPEAVVTAAVSENVRDSPNLGLLRGLVDKSGVASFRGFGGIFDLPGNGLDSVTSTYGLVEEPTGIVKALAMSGERQTPPDWVGEDVSLYGQLNFRPAQFLDAVREIVDGVNGAGAFDRSVGELEVGSTGLTVQELADAMPGPVHIAAEVPQRAADLTRQRTVLAVGVGDAGQANRIAAAVAEAAGAVKDSVGSVDVFTVPLNLPVPPEFAGRVSRPEVAFAVMDGSLLFSSDGAYLASTVRGAVEGTTRPLSESAEYREVASQFPPQTAAITYQRQDERFAGLYEELRGGNLRAAGSVGLVAGLLGFDFRKLPPFAAMSRYLQTTGSYVAPAEGGFRIVSFSLEPGEG